MSKESSRAKATAIVLAAGLSTRMGGRPKPLLPLGDSTVIEHILAALGQCTIEEIVVVTGHCHREVEHCLVGWSARLAFNPDYRSGEMLSSIQVGLRAACPESNAALIVLGDQPALERSVVRSVLAAYRDGLGSIIIPSFAMRRGHPLLVGRKHWSAILDLKEGQTLRDFMSGAAAEFHHVQVDTPAILRDMDTPEDYRRELGYFIAPAARSSSTVRRPPSRG